MYTGNKFPSHERVKSRNAAKRLFGDCGSGFAFPLKYKLIVEESASPTVEVLFSVPKRFHKRANRRNLLKRRMRESYRLSKAPLIALAKERGVKISIAMIYITREELPYNTINNATTRILAEIATRC
jgi:ribonuclease P protein component